jgi:hypothetical protein
LILDHLADASDEFPAKALIAQAVSRTVELPFQPIFILDCRADRPCAPYPGREAALS